MVEIVGTVEKILFRSESDGYTIASLVLTDSAGDDILITITGKFMDIKEGLYMRLSGVWVEHMIYGEQFDVKDYRIELPHGKHGLLNYLNSGVLKGVGEQTAHALVEKFGDNFFEVLENNPKELLSIRGIGAKTLDKILESYNAQREMRDMMLSLHEYDISSNLARKIYARFGKDTAEVLLDDPFKIALEIKGIGFTKADEIAQKIGYDLSSPKRIRAGLIYALNQCYQSGSTFLSEEELILSAEKLLQIESKTIENELRLLVESGEYVYQDFTDDGPIYYPKGLFNAESDAALAIVRLAREKIPVVENIDKKIKRVEKQLCFELDSEQKRALRAVSENPITIITGGPGTGKSATSLIVKFTKLLRPRRTVNSRWKLSEPIVHY